MREIKNIYKTLAGKPKGKKPFGMGDLSIGRMIILKCRV